MCSLLVLPFSTFIRSAWNLNGHSLVWCSVTIRYNNLGFDLSRIKPWKFCKWSSKAPGKLEVSWKSGILGFFFFNPGVVEGWDGILVGNRGWGHRVNFWEWVLTVCLLFDYLVSCMLEDAVGYFQLFCLYTLRSVEIVTVSWSKSKWRSSYVTWVRRMV